MRFAADQSAGVLSKSYRFMRKIAGIERLEVFERHISAEQALALFPEFREKKTFVELNFIPHVLMRVRFSKEDLSKRNMVSQEGEILWSLVNGEMVLNTGTWACSKGFQECLLLNADKQDIYVMQALAGLGGAASKDSLIQALAMKNLRAEKVIKECHKKKLVFASGSHISTHFQQLHPIKGCITTLHNPPVWLQKPVGSVFFPAQYSEDKVLRLVRMIFGSNFLILRSSTVYVPVYKVFLVSSDNSVRIEYVNGVTGKLFYDI
ncbi:hypothetical protein [Chlamydia sp. 17-3921]|nr:hypothetical protein [Chlamydia sp. 17-3921]